MCVEFSPELALYLDPLNTEAEKHFINGSVVLGVLFFQYLKHVVPLEARENNPTPRVKSYPMLHPI